MTTFTSPISSEEAFDLRKTDSIHLLLQALISFIVMFFCMGQLLAKTTNLALYWGGITSIVAWWMPSPAEAIRKHGTIALNSNSSHLTAHETTSSLLSAQTNSVTTRSDNSSLPAHEKTDTMTTLKSTEPILMNTSLINSAIPQQILNREQLDTKPNELLNNSLAYRLLCASVVAYGINAEGKLVLSQPYYDAVGFIHPPVAFASGEDNIDAYLVGTIDEGVILAFRGTIPPIIRDLQSWLDWINDVMGQPIEVPGFPGKVHEGFWGSLDALWNDLVTEIKRQLQINGKPLPLYITGHSKGGAIASLAAFHLTIA
ncbi:MAG TPA: lipase family protein, partial [Allocoleopsis sp.]